MDDLGAKLCLQKSREDRGNQGQFLTTPEIADGMARQFSISGLNQPEIAVLDAGAGVGTLTAAWTEVLVELRNQGKVPKLKRVRILAWESDNSIFQGLCSNLESCARVLRAASIDCDIHVVDADFIEAAVGHLSGDLFAGSMFPVLPTHAILNPPYRKIASSSKDRKLLGRLGIETSNLYSAFVWLSIKLLKPEGELVAITPRSFCNGPYFRPFRTAISESTSIRRVHVFRERGKLFNRDGVLQENIVYHLEKRNSSRRKVVISEGCLGTPSETKWDPTSVIDPNDTELFLHLAPGSSGELRDFMQSLPATLGDLGLEVSTGPVVDFRLRDSLLFETKAGAVPLLYPNTVTMGEVTPPPPRSQDQPNTRLQRKPVAIEVNEESSRWLVNVDRFVLVKRFSSKEEKKRVIAGVLKPSQFSKGLLGIENHLNFFHRKRKGLPANLAKGLALFLNTMWLDQYFRQFNGHTQVNATDLRNLRYPEESDLVEMGRLMKNWSHHEVSRVFRKVMNPPLTDVA